MLLDTRSVDRATSTSVPSRMRWPPAPGSHDTSSLASRLVPRERVGMLVLPPKESVVAPCVPSASADVTSTRPPGRARNALASRRDWDRYVLASLTRWTPNRHLTPTIPPLPAPQFRP